ncbi:FAD-binding protein [Galactobacter sp.]|uniref:L-aspartate oxidase n=1 Tax=Galactobacter sp. TaxID=2676125 RepID=UPI0025C62786|nr:FAD-binding protein [Galactobacter sp.]
MTRHLLVLGGGVAGLSATLAAAEAGLDVTLVDTHHLESSASVQAQGGLAAVIAQGVAHGDSVGSHVSDTLAAGAFHGDAAVVAAICAAASSHVDTLTRWGTAWDRTESGALSLTREAAHAHDRILHIGGDATGAGIVAALSARVRGLADQGRVRLLTDTRAVRLLTANGAVTGTRLRRPSVGRDTDVTADAVLLATGGLSGVYGLRTSRWGNPADAVGLALTAGAAIADAEMVQFHPTYAPDAAFMISEAVRGEGAVLRDASGERFMLGLDPRGELAPRDVVSRGVFGAQGGAWLDASPIVAREGRGFLATRFPTITAALARAGLDLERDPVRVTPAEHYWMGGVATDAASRSTVPGLLVAGEAARSGLHGANRLASNSLLEGVHMGLAAVATVVAGHHTLPGRPDLGASPRPTVSTGTGLELAPPHDAVVAVQALADTHLGVRRTGAGIATALRELSRLRDRHGWFPELAAAQAVATAALARTGSLGAHVRDDTAGASRPGDTVAVVAHHTTPGIHTPHQNKQLQEAGA